MFIDWAANMWKGHSLKKSVRKNSLAVTVHIIWQERNTRIFEQTSKDPRTLLNSIYNLISDRIVTCGCRVIGPMGLCESNSCFDSSLFWT